MAKKEVPEYIEKLEEFIKGISYRGKPQKALWKYQEGGVNVSIYTEGNRYIIVATPQYLGCQVETRKPRPGEDWNRGNDLADGNFSEETWLSILKDIIAYELKDISDYIITRESDDDSLTCAANQLET